jgi:hypothetical protein
MYDQMRGKYLIIYRSMNVNITAIPAFRYSKLLYIHPRSLQHSVKGNHTHMYSAVYSEAVFIRK